MLMRSWQCMTASASKKRIRHDTRPWCDAELLVAHMFVGRIQFGETRVLEAAHIYVSNQPYLAACAYRFTGNSVRKR